MIRRKFQDLELPALGMGCMRLPVCGGSGEIDIGTVERMTAYAMDHGVNYFDTAWFYHGGQSEPVMGRVLSAWPRESFYLATKFPGADPKLFADVRDIFCRQLQRLQTDHFDFYLFHNVNENSIGRFLDPANGLVPCLLEQKREGRIRHLGFSTHGSLETMRRFLDALGPELEFCQIQLNWLDWTFQDAKAKVELLKEYGLPVWVMEPVRGGRLAVLPEDAAARLGAMRPGTGAPEWAFRFLQSIPEVTVTLSGMSDLGQLKENIATFEEERLLTPAEWDGLQAVAEELIRKNLIPCTGCRYCMENCPKQIGIPELLHMYNDHFLTGGAPISERFLAGIPAERRPGACLHCRSCEAACPQNIAISDIMADFAEKIV